MRDGRFINERGSISSVAMVGAPEARGGSDRCVFSQVCLALLAGTDGYTLQSKF